MNGHIAGKPGPRGTGTTIPRNFSPAATQIALTALLLLARPVAPRAATWNTTGFHFDGQTLAITPGAVIASWQPSPKSQPNGPGAHVFFFGRPVGCHGTLRDGLAGPLTPDQVAALAATAPPPRPTGTVWSPLPGGPACAGHGRPGPSFAALGGGELRLFTKPGNTGGGFSFLPYSPTGVNGVGTDAGNVGTFVNWVFPWRDGGALAPFTGPEHSLILRSRQRVSSARADAAPTGVNQAKQAIAVNFLDPACLRQHRRLCQIRLILQSVLVGAPGIDWTRQTWSQHAMILFDRAQGGLPVIDGPFGANRAATRLPGYGMVWRSLGSATQHQPFGMREFNAVVPFDGLLRCLSAVAHKSGLALPPDWRDPEAWRVTMVSFAQEDHVTSHAEIDGALAKLSLTAQ